MLLLLIILLCVYILKLQYFFKNHYSPTQYLKCLCAVLVFSLLHQAVVHQETVSPNAETGSPHPDSNSWFVSNNAALISVLVVTIIVIKMCNLLGIPDTSLSGRSTLTALSVRRSKSAPAVARILHTYQQHGVRNKDH